MLTRRELLLTSLALPAPVVAAARALEPETQAVVAPTVRDAAFDPWVDVNAAHLRHNVAAIRSRVGGRPIMAVIKNNGYGAGVANVAGVLERTEGIAGLAVVKLQEAIALRDAGIRAPILLMGPLDGREFDEAAARDVMPMVYRPVAADLDRVAAARQQPAAVHVCIDTGIGRVGVPFRDADAYIRDLAARPSVRIAGVQMTFAEDPDFDVEQLRRFVDLCEALTGRGIRVGQRHAVSSFGLFQRPDAFLDMVRPGMALFGVYSEPDFRAMNLLDLRPVLAFKTRVAYVKQLQPGDSAGYNRAYRPTQPMWVATLPVGHADGLPRGVAKGGRVRIRGKLYPVIASVSASHTIVEIGRDRDVEVGDEVVLFDATVGSRPEDLAAATAGSVYDLMMHLNPLLPRRVIDPRP